MIRSKWIFSAILIQACLTVSAQDAGHQNQWIISAGPGYLARQDLVFSQQIHNDLSFINVGTRYIRQGNLNHSVALGFSMYQPMVTEPYTFYSDGEERTAMPHQLVYVDLDYVLGKQLPVSGSLLSLGGLFSSDVHALNYVYGRVGNFGYYAALGLGISADIGLPVGKKGSLTSSLRLPLVSWLARSPYLVNDDEFIENQSSHSGIRTFFAFLADGKLAYLNELQRFDLEAGYNYTLSDRMGIGVRYIFGFIHSTQPRNLLSYSHHVDLTAHVNF